MRLQILIEMRQATSKEMIPLCHQEKNEHLRMV